MSIDDPRFAPGFSPDGITIAYISNAEHDWADDLWSISVASGEGRKMTSTLMAPSTPV